MPVFIAQSEDAAQTRMRRVVRDRSDSGILVLIRKINRLSTKRCTIFKCKNIDEEHTFI